MHIRTGNCSEIRPMRGGVDAAKNLMDKLDVHSRALSNRIFSYYSDACHCRRGYQVLEIQYTGCKAG